MCHKNVKLHCRFIDSQMVTFIRQDSLEHLQTADIDLMFPNRSAIQLVLKNGDTQKYGLLKHRHLLQESGAKIAFE